MTWQDHLGSAAQEHQDRVKANTSKRKGVSAQEFFYGTPEARALDEQILTVDRMLEKLDGADDLEEADEILGVERKGLHR